MKKAPKDKYDIDYTSNIADLPIGCLATAYIVKLLDPKGKSRLSQSASEKERLYGFIVYGIRRTQLHQDIVFSALLYLRRVVHFHGPTLGPLGDSSLYIIIIVALDLAHSFLIEPSYDTPAWVKAFFEPLDLRAKVAFLAGPTALGRSIAAEEYVVQQAFINLVQRTRVLFCRAIYYDLIPNSKQHFDPFKASVIALHEGKSATRHIKDVTSRCVFWGYEKPPNTTDYECKCSHIDIEPVKFFEIGRERREKEVKAMFPVQGASASVLAQGGDKCGYRSEGASSSFK